MQLYVEKPFGEHIRKYICIDTNKELHWSSYKWLHNAVNTKLRKEKCNYYSTRLSDNKDSKEMWKTLNEILPKKKYPRLLGTV